MAQEQGLPLPWRVLMAAAFWIVGAFLLALAIGVIAPGADDVVAPPFILALAGVGFLLFGLFPLVAADGRKSFTLYALMFAVSAVLAALAAWAALGGGEITTSSSFGGVTHVNENGNAEGRIGFAIMAVLCGVFACVAGFLALRRLSRGAN